MLQLIAVAGGVLSGIATTAPAIQVLDAGCSWARRCRIPSFVNLYHRIQKHRAAIVATLTHGLSNALVESTNTRLRLLTRMAYGFKSTDNLIALCLLDRSGYCPPLPGRQAAACPLIRQESQ